MTSTNEILVVIVSYIILCTIAICIAKRILP
jgi:hypothetical protein